MKLRQIIALLVFATLTLCLASCGGSGSSPTPPLVISVTLNSPPTTLATGATAALTATVANDSKNAGVSWTVTCATSSCGSFNPTTTASGATTFTAPAAPATVTIIATSVSDTTKSASATITVALPAISVAFNPQPPTSLAAGSTGSLIAVVSNDAKNAGVSWTVTCGTSPCGSFSPTSTASGVATTYTAPVTVPTPNTVTITATSVTDSTKSASATITIGGAPALLADGTYVFHLSGQDAPTSTTQSAGPYFVVGAFTVKGGVITAGEQDFGDFNFEYNQDALVPSGCSITKAGSNTQIVLATANIGVGVNGIETLRGTAVSSSRILISEFDAFAAATGSVDLQTTVATPSGGYAFALSGLDETTDANTLVVGGILNFSGGNLQTGNSSVLDYNDGGNVGQAEPFNSGTVSTPDSFGRVTFTFTFASTSPVPNFILTGYVVGPNQIQLLENQPDTLGADIGGVALGQGTNTAKFSQTSVVNSSYVHASSGADTNGLATLAGQFTFNSAGGVSGQLALNDGINFGAGAINSATYIVDATGRVTIQGVTVSTLPAMTFQLYLDGNGNALELGVDSFQITQGFSYQQNAPPTDFEGTYAIAGQGYLPGTTVAPFWSAVGPVTVNSDAFQGTTDYTIQGATPTSAVALTGTETSSTGLLSIIGLNGTGFTTANSYGYYVIDSKRVLAIEIDGQQLGLLQMETVSH